MAVDDNVMTGLAIGDEVELVPDAAVLRAQEREQYRQVAADPGGSYHFRTGRALGVGNPFSLRRLERGERVVDIVFRARRP